MWKRISASSMILALVAFLLIIGALACVENVAVETSPDETSPADISGTWRAVLESPGGEIPFIIKVSNSEFGPQAMVINGGRGRPMTTVTVTGNHVEFSFLQYIDSTIKGEVSTDGTVMTGEWDPPYADDPDLRVAFRAERGVPARFPASDLEPASFSGTWKVTFNGFNGKYQEQGEFMQQGDIVTGALISKEGFFDSQYLEGRVNGNEMQLSLFDGARGYLFIAQMQEDGTTEGEFWSAESTRHVTWTATRWTDGMGEPYVELTHLTSKDGRFPFSFPDVYGKTITDSDERFAGKALIIHVTGVRGLNNYDEVKLLKKLYYEYRGRGLEIVNLAVLTDFYEAELEQKKLWVQRYAEINRITWPVLMIDLTQMTGESENLRASDKVMASYPSTFFVGRDGIVRSEHAGFYGPDTGEYYEKLVEDFRARIEEILLTSAQ